MSSGHSSEATGSDCSKESEENEARWGQGPCQPVRMQCLGLSEFALDCIGLHMYD